MTSKLFNIAVATTISALVLFTTAGCSDNSATTDVEPVATDNESAATTDVNADVNAKPLSEQPKAMIDKAQSQVDDINRLNEDNLEQLNHTKSAN